MDQSLKNAFRPLVQAAVEARRQIEREFAAVPKAIGEGARRAAGEGKGAYAGLAAAARTAAAQELAEARRVERERVASVRRAQREILAEHRRVDRDRMAIERASNREREQLERAAAALQRQRSAALFREHVQQERLRAREIDRFATRTSHRFTRFVAPNFPVASFARRAAHGVMAGFGVDPTFAGAARRNISLEDQAVAFSNQARVAGQEVAPKQFEDAARGAQKRLGIDAEKGAGTLTNFQKMTGDAGLSLDVFQGLMDRSARFNIDPDQLGMSAGNISKALGDIPNKAQAIFKVLDTLMVQTTKGAIEPSDLQTQVAKFTAPARLISGDAGENTARLAAMAQIARDVGGAASPQQAATAISSMMNTFDKGARAKAFAAAGIQMRDSKTGMLRDPFQLIKEAIVHTKGDDLKMNTFIMDAQAKRAARGFLSEFKRVGGGVAGEKAMDALMDRYMSGSISPDTEKKNLEQHMGKTSVQAAQFQAEFDEVVKEMQSALLPTLRELQPTVLKLTKGFGELAAWVLSNPWKAVIAALLAVLARAGLESAVRGGIDIGARAVATRASTAVLGAAGTSGGAVAGGAAAGAGVGAGALTAGLAVGAAGMIAGVMATKKQIGATDGTSIKSMAKSSLLDLAIGVGGSPLLAALGVYQAGRGIMGLFGKDKEAKPQLPPGVKAPALPTEDLKTNMVEGRPGQTAAQLKKEILEGRANAAKDEREASMAKNLDTIAKGKIKVEVVNFPEDAGEDPSVDDSGRG